MKVRSLARSHIDSPMTAVTTEPSAPAAEGFRWIDVLWDETRDLDFLSELHGCDPAAIEDIIDIEQLPKVDDYGDQIFVVLHALTADGTRVDTVEVDCFVSENLLVTVHRSNVVALDWLWQSVQRYQHLTNEGTRELFAHLSEAIGRRYLEVIAEFERRVDELSEPAINGDPVVIGEIQALRREESTIRTMLRPQRLVIRQLQRMPAFTAGEDTRRQLTDAYDVHNQIVEMLASARQLLTDTLDTYRGAAAEVQGRAATLLTVYAAIVLPMTLIAGWYGMNTANLPAATRSWGWIVVTGVMIAVGVVSWISFVRMGLIARTRRTRALASGVASVARRPMHPTVMLRKPKN